MPSTFAPARICRAAVSAAVALAAILILPQSARATARPDPLEPGPGCDRWVGESGGNDPTVQLDLVLCPEGQSVQGQTQWSSLRSGWNLRVVEGSWSTDGKTLSLRDVRIVKEKPNPGWRFCTIDLYELHKRGDSKLQGSYHSSSCHDDAWVRLSRVPSSSPVEPSADPAQPSAAPAGSVAQGERSNDGDEPRPAHKGCGCALALGSRNGAPSNVLAAVAAVISIVLGGYKRRQRRWALRALGPTERMWNMKQRIRNRNWLLS